LETTDPWIRIGAAETCWGDVDWRGRGFDRVVGLRPGLRVSESTVVHSGLWVGVFVFAKRERSRHLEDSGLGSGQDPT
jgi:hypothetical protein